MNNFVWPPQSEKKLGSSTSIIKKGIFLIALPLTLQVVLLAFLVKQVDRVEQLYCFESRRADVVQELNGLLTDYSDGWGTIFTAILSADTKKALTAEAFRESCKVKISHLIAITKDDPELAGPIYQFQVMADDLQSQMIAFTSMAENDSMSSSKKLGLLKPAIKKLQTATRVIKDLLTMMHAQIEHSEQERSNSNQVLKIVLVFGFVADLAMIPILTMFFLRSIKSRLEILLQNTHALTENTPTFKSVSGSDEIAYVNDSLCAISAELIESRQKRSQIVRMVAHDIRSPLTSAALVIHKIKQNVGNDNTRMIGRLESSITRVSSLVKDFLSAEQFEEGTLKLSLAAVSAKDLAEDAVQTVSPVAQEKGLEIVQNCERFDFMADGDRLTQVLVNLLSNAIKFTSAGGTIKVDARYRNEKAIFSVTNMGTIIKRHEREHLFEQFRQGTNTVAQGHGLGLYICKTIVDLHGGDIGVDSDAISGNRFWFTIPQVEE